MLLMNICVIEVHRVLLRWTVVQIEPNLTFVRLFEIIRHPWICNTAAELSHVELKRVLVGYIQDLLQYS